MTLDERFTNAADSISEAAGKWPATVVSVCLLVVWTWYCAWKLGNGWFTSNQYNFPLNTVTTVGEWFSELLILASANRVQRYIMHLLERMDAREAHIEQLLQGGAAPHSRKE